MAKIEKYNLNPFDGKNFDTWKYRMEMISLENDVLERIVGEPDSSERLKKKDIRSINFKVALIVQYIDDTEIQFNSFYLCFALKHQRGGQLN